MKVISITHPEILSWCYVNVIFNSVLKSSWQSVNFMLVIPQWVYPENFHRYSSVRENISMTEGYYLLFYNMCYKIQKNAHLDFLQDGCFLVSKWCPTFCNLMDCSLPGSSVHGISQARILEWMPLLSPEYLPKPGIKPTSPALAAGFFTTEPTL